MFKVSSKNLLKPNQKTSSVTGNAFPVTSQAAPGTVQTIPQEEVNRRKGVWVSVWCGRGRAVCGLWCVAGGREEEERRRTGKICCTIQEKVLSFECFLKNVQCFVSCTHYSDKTSLKKFFECFIIFKYCSYSRFSVFNF